MIEKRKVAARHGQLLVALPATVRDHLTVESGSVVYWHIVQAGEVSLSPRPSRRGGRPRDSASCSACAAREEELRKVRALLHTKQAVMGRQFFTQGYAAALSHYGAIANKLDVVLALVKSLPGLRSHRSRTRAVKRHLIEEGVMLPDDAPPRVSEAPTAPAHRSEGDAATAEAAPPALPAET